MLPGQHQTHLLAGGQQGSSHVINSALKHPNIRSYSQLVKLIHISLPCVGMEENRWCPWEAGAC